MIIWSWKKIKNNVNFNVHQPFIKRYIIESVFNGDWLSKHQFRWAILSLIPKVPGADDIKQFRPIALINVIFKLISKAYAIRLSPVAHRIISGSQTAFIKGRHIHDGALGLHEIVHELHVSKTRAVILKLDFEKAYNRVSWAFLRDVLVHKGFESGVVHRLMQLY
jgi:hypothetical protein